ncbi:MAG: hypothetical protein QOD72_942 [Acidimicrobiaceae bacterium]|jgi:hypothetical protein|nr:hypothetical protein [Acidimicrobiaceae bacterium]
MPSHDSGSAEWLSDRLVLLVQMVFGFVLADGLGRYAPVVLRPWRVGNRLTALALLGVYVVTIMSWIDWHGTVVRHPYDFGDGHGGRRADRLRFGADLFVVSVYAFTLFAVGQIADAGASTYVFGFVAMFAGYVASGWLRRRSYGRLASNLRPIVIFGVVTLVAWLVLLVFEANEWAGRRGRATVGVIVAVAVMGSFRWVHTHERVCWRRRRANDPHAA